MREFPQELVYVFIFAAIWLAQLLYKMVVGKAQQLQAEVDPVKQAGSTTSALRATAPAPGTAPSAPYPAYGQNATNDMTAPSASGRTRPRESRGGRAVRRFSRAGLMPDRRAVQDAIVISAILQPCLARRARDVD